MPFTAAHPLAVVPLLRRFGLDPTCLVIGSMAPDFEYFVRGEQISSISHTLAGLWLWNLPATLVLAALLHALVKPALLLVAPVAIARRATRLARPWRAHWGVAAIASCVISALIGAATHLAWDSLTHAKGWGPRHYAALKTPIALPGVGTVVVHRALQHASTLVGLVVLAALIVRGLARARPIALPQAPRLTARLLVVGCMALAAALIIARLVGKRATDPGDLIVGAIAGVLAGLVVASAALAPRARRFQRAVIAVNATAIV